MTKNQKIELIKLLEEKAKREKAKSLWNFQPYDWQQDFYKAGKQNKQRLLMAANRVGKTRSSCIELSYHLTGRYPDWWDGIRFNFPINAWALGVSGEQIRDVLQKEIFGFMDATGFDGNGLIPVDMIGEITRSMTPKLAKDVKVKHVTGGYSTLSFKSYTQGQHVLMGTSIDFALIDEEPEDDEIYPQVLTRTATGNKGKGGYVVLSFTPENGVTRLVAQFTQDIKPGQYLKNVTWDDAPHLTEEVKAQILEAYPEYQREMRTKGIPLLGSGVVFPVNEDRIKEILEEIPSHWPRIVGIDFGWDHPTAIAWLAWDRDNDVVHLYNCAKITNETPAFIAPIIRKMKDWIPVAWPHDGLQHDKGSGVQLAEQYRQEGVNMLDQMATFEDGSNGVEAGLMDMLTRMRTERFKVNANCGKFFEEFRMYHRKDGKIVKLNDDLISAVRYGIMMLRHAETEPIEANYDDYEPEANNSLGY
jgi:phage terminase large subunit-like protein